MNKLRCIYYMYTCIYTCYTENINKYQCSFDLHVICKPFHNCDLLLHLIVV